MTRPALITLLALLLLPAACTDAPDSSPAAPGPKPKPAAVVDGTIHVLSFFALNAYAEGVPCVADDPVPLASAARAREDLVDTDQTVLLATIGDTLVDPIVPLRGKGARVTARARAGVILDAMALAGVDIWVPGHNDLELLGVEGLLEAAESRGVTVLLSNAELKNGDPLTPYLVLQDGTLRLALLGALSPRDSSGQHLPHTGLRIFQPKRHLREVANGIMSRGEADMVAVLSAMPNADNHKVGEIGSVSFIIGAADAGLAANMVVRRTGANLMAHMPSGQELAQTTFRVVDGDWNMADMSPLWAMPKELAEEARSLDEWEQTYGTRDPLALAQRVMPGREREFIDKFQLHEDNLAFLEEYADYAGSMLAHHAVPFVEVGEDDPIVKTLARQGPAMIAAAEAIAGEPPQFEGENRIALPEDCASCHPAQYSHWKRTGHARSYDDLKDQGRHLDVSCLPCHAAGFGQGGTGYRDPRLDGPFGGFTCWSCHAANVVHFETRAGVVEPESVPIRHADAMTSSCGNCHGDRRSPGFDADSAMEQLACPPMSPQEPALVLAYKQALASLERGRMSESFTPRHRYLEGRALVGMGRREEGLALIREYAAESHGHTLRTIEIANYLDRHGDSHTAVEVLRKHTELNPGSLDAHLAYAYVLVNASDETARNPGQAASHLGVLSPFDPNEKMDAQQLPYRKLQVEALFESGRNSEGRELLIFLIENFRENDELQELLDRYLSN